MVVLSHQPTGGHGWRAVSPARWRASRTTWAPRWTPRAVGRVCRELGHGWRERELDPATTVALFVQQVLHGNCPCSEVRHLEGAAGRGKAFTASAYCQARARLPLAVYQSLLTDVID